MLLIRFYNNSQNCFQGSEGVSSGCLAINVARLLFDMLDKNLQLFLQKMQWAFNGKYGKNVEFIEVPESLRDLEVFQSTKKYAERDGSWCLDQTCSWNGVGFQRTDFFCATPEPVAATFKLSGYFLLFMLKGKLELANGSGDVIAVNQQFYWLAKFKSGVHMVRLAAGKHSFLLLDLKRKHVESLATISPHIKIQLSSNAKRELTEVGKIQRDMKMLLHRLVTCKSVSPEREWYLQSTMKALLAACSLQLKQQSNAVALPPTLHFTKLDFDQYISEHLSESLTIQTIAKAYMMSVTSFKKLFSATLGTSVHQYILEKKMEIGKELLTTSNLSVYNISLQTGFSSASHFIRRFRKQFHITPQQYRKDQRGS